MFERPRSGERALLIHLNLQQESEREDLDEFRDLTLSAGADPLITVTSARRTPDAKYFIGSGKADEVKQLVAANRIELVLVNHAISPAQERNLEALIECRVLDRTGLILDIFAQRARTHEGKLQVELAQLTHLSTRLVRGWSHLERQKGGIGLRGPGETQLETDRRLLGLRIKQLNRRLERVRQQRQQNRQGRSDAQLPTVTLVGYTNAGKSTLFNRLCQQQVVYAADQLFATLDPTLRRVELPSQEAMILADTVGFIRHLPHDLVESFRSTLTETREADLLLHVIDASDPERAAKIDQVNRVLADIGAEQVPQMEIYNKIDTLAQEQARLIVTANGLERLYLSAHSGAGIDLLLSRISERFIPACQRISLTLPPSAGRLRSRLFSVAEVLHEKTLDDGRLQIEAEISLQALRRLQKEPQFSPLLAQASTQNLPDS
ncbi:GTPase HflX [Ectothiorhodospiraceae bacterium BW-2]|nr:GTPase HflX [Ectothiorhodospiraceae bacterium BW-2]